MTKAQAKKFTGFIIIKRVEDGNHRERESVTGRIYTSKSIREVWVATVNNADFDGEWSSLKQAADYFRSLYPNADIRVG